MRNILNSLRNKNWPFYDRHYVYPIASNFKEDQPADMHFVHYEYMHIRMKPQSTKYRRASPTSNSIPKYVILTIDSRNMLQIWDNTHKVQNPFQNTRRLMNLNLTAEGICDSPYDIIGVSTSITPANSYRKDN